MSEHTITINLENGHAWPEPANRELYLGDTVVYVTDPPNLPFRVEFVDGSPFTGGGALTITDSRPWTVSEKGKGKFFSRCYITGPEGEVGWSEQNPGCGGEHDVRP